MKKLVTALLALGLAYLAFTFIGPVELKLPQLTAQARVSRHIFKVEIEGLASTAFSSVDGLSSELEVIEFTDGATGETRKRPGRVKYGDITLKRGVTADRKDMLQWYMDTVGGKGKRKSMSIVMFDAAGKEVSRYNCFECFPKSWHGPSQPTESAALAIEKIEIAIEKIEMAQ